MKLVTIRTDLLELYEQDKKVLKKSGRPYPDAATVAADENVQNASEKLMESNRKVYEALAGKEENH